MSWEAFLENNYEVKRTGNPRGFRINCPFCGDNKFHGYVDTKKQFFKCFKCNWSHKPGGTATTAYHFLIHAHGFSKEKAQETIKSNFAPLMMEDGLPRDLDEAIKELVKEEQDQEEEPFFQKVIMPKSELLKPNLTSIMGRRAWTYWKNRLGKNAESIANIHKVRYSVQGKYKGRIIVPVFENNKIVWLQARSYFPIGLEPKYMQPKDISKPVFGLDVCGKKADIIICEGVFDAMVVNECALCIFGTSMTDFQMHKILAKDPNSITVCLDPDEAGIEGTKRICEKLTSLGSFENLYFVVDLPSDPASLGDSVRNLILEKQKSYKFEPIF